MIIRRVMALPALIRPPGCTRAGCARVPLVKSCDFTRTQANEIERRVPVKLLEKT